ncbi:MAG: GtrA family protein [Firmicutes bacterium]|nr:GtrA family protein [Bacillota bacterium]
MFKLYKKYEEIINYLIFGVLTTIVSIITYFICSKIFNINYLISNIISWILSVLFAFITNKLYVFKSKNKNKNIIIKELISFFSSRIFTFLIDMGLMYILVSILKVDDMLSKLVTQIIVIVLNYILSKLYVFKKTIVQE